MICDLHCDTFYKLYYSKKELYKNDYHVDVLKLKKSNYLLQVFAMFINMNKVNDIFNYVNKMIDLFYYELNKNKAYLKHILTSNDIDYCIKNNLIGCILSIEEGAVINNDLKKLDYFYNRGVRIITLTWNYPNCIGYPSNNLLSNSSLMSNKGLTDFGINVIKKMEELNMIIDVSHGSDKLVLDVLKYSKKPFIASHSNSRKICDHKRNLPDYILCLLKERGCLVGINFATQFINSKQKKTKVKDIVKHIKHIVNIMGVDLVCFGTDFDGIDSKLEIKNAGKMKKFYKILKKAKFKEEDIKKICYLNVYNFFKKVL